MRKFLKFNDGGDSGQLRSLKVPYLPDDAPEAPTPENFVHELFPHQKRALHRMIAIERDEKFLAKGFSGKKLGTHLDYSPKGGVLSDLVGMGKTATTLALICSEPKDPTLGPSLLVAPTHLVGQWAREAEKFCPSGVQVITGLQNYQDIVRAAPHTLDNRTLVVVDANSVLKSRRYHYEFRELFAIDAETGKRKKIPLSTDQVNLYRKKATSISPGFKGTFYGHGGPKEQALFFPHLVLANGREGFRRVMFDEVQDLIEEGKSEKDCLLQLTMYTRNVWLITATPFPAGSRSVYGNHQLLGFPRLRLQCESTTKLPHDHPFEIIKRQLYIRSPVAVRDRAIKVKHTVKVVECTLSPIESTLYRILARKFRMDADEAQVGVWDECFDDLRASLGHVAAALSTRKELTIKKKAGGQDGVWKTIVPTTQDLAFYRGMMLGLCKELLEKRKRDFANRAAELALLQNETIAGYRGLNTLLTAILEQDCRKHMLESEEEAELFFTKHDIRAIVLLMDLLSDQSQIKEEGKQDRSLKKKQQRKLNEEVAMSVHAMRNYAIKFFVKMNEDIVIKNQRRVEYLLKKRIDKADTLAQNLPLFKVDIKELQSRLKDRESLQSLPKYGTKMKTLRETLASLPQGEQAVVFSNHEGILDVAKKVLHWGDIEAVRLTGNSARRSEAILDFTSQKATVLLACMQQAASGTNLQCAQHVVFLDLPGNSAKQAADMITQAQGRVIRMGQEKPVTIHYLICNDTIEVKLAQQVLFALEHSKKDEDGDYKVQPLQKALPPPIKGSSASSTALMFEGIQVIQQKTLEERLSEALEEAQRNGQVLELTDDETEDNATQTTETSKTSTHTPPYNPKASTSSYSGAVPTVKLEKGFPTQSTNSNVKLEKGLPAPCAHIGPASGAPSRKRALSPAPGSEAPRSSTRRNIEIVELD